MEKQVEYNMEERRRLHLEWSSREGCVENEGEEMVVCGVEKRGGEKSV